MGLYFGEGAVLQRKYMTKYGLTKSEANKKVGEFINKINNIKAKMHEQRKSAVEIEAAAERYFQEEFQKLCAMGE